MTNTKFGLSNWDENPNDFKKSSKPFDGPRLKFMKLKEGNNVVRVITRPYKYTFISYKNQPDEKGYGTKIRCSDPVESCPTVAAGFRAKEHWFVGIIDRTDSEVKILDIGSLVYGQVKNLKDDIEWGSPTEYDLAIRKNSKAPPAGFYNTLPRGKAPLSDADLRLKDENFENLEDSLKRLSAAQTKEKALAAMETCGYIGGLVPQPVSAKAKAKAEELAASSDSDYEFSEAAPN